MPLNATALSALKAWLAVRPAADHQFVFTGKGGQPLKSSGVQDILGELGRVAGVEVTPYTLRHTCAKNLIDRGVPLNQVTTLLGHSSLNTTRIYSRAKPIWSGGETRIKGRRESHPYNPFVSTTLE